MIGQELRREKMNKPGPGRVKYRLKTARFRFTYTFESGYHLTGTVEGDAFHSCPNQVFNLRALHATCRQSQSQTLLAFDEVYGQFNLDFPGILFSGMHAATGSFFSFNYRGREANIYDAKADRWLAIGWTPANWSVTELADQPIAQHPVSGRLSPVNVPSTELAFAYASA